MACSDAKDKKTEGKGKRVTGQEIVQNFHRLTNFGSYSNGSWFK